MKNIITCTVTFLFSITVLSQSNEECFSNLSIFAEYAKVKNYKDDIIKAKVLSTEGSVPSELGNYMLISSKDIYGTIGGGHLEYLIINKSKELLKVKVWFSFSINSIIESP